MEILFRGFHECDGPTTIVVDGRKVKGQWVEGLFGYAPMGAYGVRPSIYVNEHGWCTPVEIIPTTVGQFCGLTDKSGKKIFAGDIIKTEDGSPKFVFWKPEYCAFICKDVAVKVGDPDDDWAIDSTDEVIGTVWDEVEQ